MAMKIYTRTGDTGKTSLIGGTRVPKNDPRIEAYGTVDELNSQIGLVAGYGNEPQSKAVLKEIQDRLFTIGAELACDPDKQTRMALPGLDEKDVTLLENEMDRMDRELPTMKHFILPGGSIPVSVIHIARCVCRRAERCCVTLSENSAGTDRLILIYLNRLSDYLFMLARYTAMNDHTPEVIWKPRI